jgi:type II secretory pathway pseudopilin PulG
MWALAVTVALAAVTGVYMLPAQRSLMAVQDQNARELAESMGLYRQAVVAYFSANNSTLTSVQLTSLKTAGFIPTWSTLYTQSSTSIWANYRDSAGNIFIYPTTLPSTSITSELLALSQNAVTVGVYRASDRSVYSPADGTRVSFSSLNNVSIPDAAPVWLARGK